MNLIGKSREQIQQRSVSGTLVPAKASGPPFRSAVQRQQLAEQIKRPPIDIRKIVPDELRDKPREPVDLLSSRFFQKRIAEKETNIFVEFLESRRPDTGDATLRELVHLMMSSPHFN